MDNDTIRKWNKKLTEQAKIHYKKAEEIIKMLPSMNSEDVDFINYVKELQLALEHKNADTFYQIKGHMDFWDYFKNIQIDWKEVDLYFSCIQKIEHNKNCLDSEILHMEGDLVITDPCYVIKKDLSNPPRYPECENFNITYHDYVAYKNNELLDLEKITQAKAYSEAIYNWEELLHAGDWSLSDCGRNAKGIGLNTSLVRDNLYGDWSCTVFNTDTNDKIGEFCADAGMVGIFLLNEILQYDPTFRKHLDKPWTMAVIKGFKGDVQIKVNRITGTYETESDYHKKGETWTDDEVQVVGVGNINFVTKQTGL